jgi:5-amino-6-(5-phosphoribosylamino)uracil reductase
MSNQDFFVFTNLAVSMDGKITTKDRAHIDPSRHDRYLMDFQRARAHAVVMGAGTLRAFRQPALIEHRRFHLLRRAKRLNLHPINVVVARKLDFDPSWPFFREEAVERVLVVPAGTPDHATKPFHSLAHILKYSGKADDYPTQLIPFLAKLGCRNLLIEGGGGILFPWVESDLVDEWNITLVPKIIGGEAAPTMVEGEGFDASRIKTYRLRKVRRRGDELFLRYVRP